MARIYFILVILTIVRCLQAQNVGINTNTPVMPFHVASSNEDLTVFENTTPLNNAVQSNLYFANGLNGPNPIKYTGAIKTIGSGDSYARLGLFTYASQLPSDLIERLSILDNGNVGIGTINPLYKLEVNGPVRFQNDLQINGSLNPGNVLTIGNNTTIGGTLTVASGKGIVRSTSSTQMKIKRISIGISATNFGAGSTLTNGILGFGEDFASVTVTVGQGFNGTGDWAKVLIVPCNVDNVANTCQFKITNVSNASIDFTGNWEVVLTGN